MVKYLLNILIMFLMLSSFAFADIKLAQLQSEYGHDLNHAPFFLRFSFQKEFNIEWKESYYSQRLAFLMEYDKNLAEDQARERAEAKAEADMERENKREKYEALLQQKEKLKEQIAEEKAEEEADEEPQKEMKDIVKEQESELKQMERDATQGNH